MKKITTSLLGVACSFLGGGLFASIAGQISGVVSSNARAAKPIVAGGSE